MNPAHVTLDAHPLEEAVIVRYQASPPAGRHFSMETHETQKIINLKDLSDSVDIASLASVVLTTCPIIPEILRQELEQVLYYLQKRRKAGSRAGSASVSGDSPVVKADIEEVESYIELFYEDIPEKTRGALCIFELSKNPAHLLVLIENETLIGALSRVFREDWKRNYELATTIARVFVKFSYYSQFQIALSHHKVGALCLNMVDYELKRGEAWLAESKTGDEKTAKKLRLALKKQQALLAECLTILLNLAVDINVELKMVRRDIVPLLVRCIMQADSLELQSVTVQLMLKLSIFDENKNLLEGAAVIDRLLSLFPITDNELRKATLQLLFNLSFESKARARMVAGGLVSHVAPLIQTDSKALNMLYQLSINDDAKAMITFTDAIQFLMRDLLSGTGSDVTKAVLINACVEKRNAQLVCGPNGQGLDLLMESSLDNHDLLVAKVIRSIAVHEGPTQEMFTKWLPRLLSLGVVESIQQAEERASLGLECIGAAAVIRPAEWANLCTEHELVPWMDEQLKLPEREPLQLQIVIMCGTMAKQLEAARKLVPLLEVFINLLHSMQVDDEFVVQLLFLFLQLLRHKELSDRLMGPQSALGSYIIDLMHDKNAAIREMCSNALVIIGEHSQEWARRIAAERFRWHNEQWLGMVETGHDDDMPLLDDDYGGDLFFDDQYDFDEERVF